MPKPGMKGITLRDEVADLLHKKAADAGQGLNDYLLSIMMGPSLQPSMGLSQDNPQTVQLLQQTVSLLQTLNQKIPSTLPQNTKQAPFLGTASFAKEGVVRSPGFGPGFLPWQGNVLD